MNDQTNDSTTQSTILDDVVNQKLKDIETPGVVVDFDPEEAEHAGAFVEDALSLEDAEASQPDALEATTVA